MCRVIPYYDAKIPAGFPSPANDYLEKAISLDEAFIKHPLSTFMVSTEGDSMNGAFIPNKAIILVDRSLSAKTGDIVLVHFQGEFTVKYISFKNKQCLLIPANEKYKPIAVTEEMQMQVWGVVIKIIIDPKDIRYVRPC